jgi:hypothetical protein
MVEARLTIGGLDRLCDGFHVDAFPKPFVTSIFCLSTGPVSRRIAPT